MPARDLKVRIDQSADIFLFVCVFKTTLVISFNVESLIS